MNPDFPALVRYRLCGRDDPELVPRVFGQLARRGIVPAAAELRRAAGMVSIVIEADCLDVRTAAILAETLRSQVLVECVAFEPAAGEAALDRLE